jgi:DNA-binding NarL/FixJ family response regulator
MLGVVVVDDHAMMRGTLRAFLDHEPTLELIGEAADGIEAIQLIQQLRPDVVLMDVHMPRMGGIESTHHIHALLPHTLIIGMSSNTEPWVERAFLAAGARAFLPKLRLAGCLLEVIHRESSP